MGLLKRIFGKQNKQPSAPRAKAQVFSAQMAPEQPFCAVGDLHGCLAQFEKIADLVAAQGMEKAPLVFVGDFVDRGEHSAQLLQSLMPMQKAEPDRIICLQGNHEKMMLDVLQDPVKHGARWLKHGGLQTVASFGVQPVLGTGSAEAWQEMGQALRDAMGDELIQWVTELPLSWRSGNVFVCHAGADPLVPLQFQSPEVMLWGAGSFTQMVRDDGNWVLHGHTIMPEAVAQDGRISIDTGCYATGTLTCAKITSQGADFLSIKA
jgi:serine/threonine protein phosphatase 1